MEQDELQTEAKLKSILADIDVYQRFQDQLSTSVEQAESARNERVLADVVLKQDGRDD